MDAAGIQSKIYKAYGKAASILGQTFSHYRPLSATAPIADPNLLGTMPVSLNAEDMNYSKPNKYGKPTWYALLDGSVAQVGDYLVGDQGTFFIAAMQPLLPILAVECNRTITVFRPHQQTDVGEVEYGGNTEATETALMTGWPASVLQGTKGEKSEAGLPGDSRTPWWAILLPYSPGVTIDAFDAIEDDLGRRYVVSSAELTDLGWRCTAMLAVP